MKIVETGTLYARPSFIEGMSRLFDVSNSLNIYNEEETANKADIKAIENDFKIVGQDILNALKYYVNKK